jgi:hypothetical protein
MTYLYEKNKFNLWTFNLQTHFKEHNMFIRWSLPGHQILKLDFTYKLIHLYQQLQSYLSFKINNFSFYSIPPTVKVLPQQWLTHLANIFYCQCNIYANTIVYFNTTFIINFCFVNHDVCYIQRPLFWQGYPSSDVIYLGVRILTVGTVQSVNKGTQIKSMKIYKSDVSQYLLSNQCHWFT